MNRRPTRLPAAVRSLRARLALAVLSSLQLVESRGISPFGEAFHAHATGGPYGAPWLAPHDLFKSEGLPSSVYGACPLSRAAQGRSAGG